MIFITKIIIIDPSLKDFRGHYYEYDKAIAEELNNLKYEYLVYTHKEVIESIRKEINCYPLFSSFVPKFNFKIKSINSLYYFIVNNLYYAKSLYKIKNKLGIKTIILIPDVNHFNLFAIIILVLRNKSRCEKLFLLFRSSYFGAQNLDLFKVQRFLISFGLKLLKVLTTKKKIELNLITDSQLLTNEYYKISNLNFITFPIPHTPKYTSDISSINKSFRVTVLGDLRIEKGIRIIIQAINKFNSENKNIVFPIDFYLQSNYHISFADKYKFILNELETIRCFNNVKLIENSINSYEYNNLLSSSDIIILPYDANEYRNKTSGIFVESIAQGIPVIVTKETWMAYELDKLKCGISIENNDYHELVQAIKEMYKNYPFYKSQSLKAKDKWRSFHNNKTFVSMLVNSQQE